MSNAALTYVFNENVNLPIWVKYYGNLFGEENLFVIDRQSTDHSTENLGKVNVIRVPRTKFDDHDKSHALSSMHSALLRSYDTVVCTDCDEIIVANPAKYNDLNDYIARTLIDYATVIGLNLIHVIDREMPLNFDAPILEQRKYATFTSTECKTLINRIPLTWAPGLHSTKNLPKFDTDLLLFHLKLMDYATAISRQKVNQDTLWSENSLEKNHGNHHRFDMKRFVTETFLSVIKEVDSGSIFEFQFGDVVSEMIKRLVRSEAGFYELPFGISKNVKIPDEFVRCL